MNRTGAFLVRYALEEIGVTHTFGIPGVHNTEIYDELAKSEKIMPVLVTHELGGSFMADAISRTTDSIGTLVIVPAAGTTHAMSGIGEAYLDGIPMLIISGGVRRDTGREYQLHQLDQGKLVSAITKGYFLIQNHQEILSTIYQAYELAISGEPGPVFVEVPSNLLLFNAPIDELTSYRPRNLNPEIDHTKINIAADMLVGDNQIGIYAGWGARNATAQLIDLAELLQAPVSTTMQGISVFPHGHQLHTGMGFGPSGVPASQAAFKNVRTLLAVGVRFGELATGSYGLPVPANLIHIDINRQVFDKNYKSTVAIQGDAGEALTHLIDAIKKRRKVNAAEKNATMVATIRQQKEAYFESWINEANNKIVDPGPFFKELRRLLPAESFVLLDDGNHTFLAAELFPVSSSKHMISPTDFNAMGYCVPATIGVKLAHPECPVIGIVGDGGFLMTGMELLTASTNNLGVIIFVFHDGELGQISQFQKIPLNRKTCTILGDIKIEGVALATGAKFIEINSNSEISTGIQSALEISKTGRPVLVDVKIDYSKKTSFTKGVVKVNLARFPLGEKVRFIGRAIKRHMMG